MLLTKLNNPSILVLWAHSNRAKIMATVELTEIQDLSDIVRRLTSGESFVVRNAGKEIAVLVASEDPELLEAIEDYLDNIAADKSLAEPGDPIPYDSLRHDLGLADASREARN